MIIKRVCLLQFLLSIRFLWYLSSFVLSLPVQIFSIEGLGWSFFILFFFFVGVSRGAGLLMLLASRKFLTDSFLL